MEGIARLAYTTVMVSASGALSPGPLTMATIALGVDRGWRAGLQVGLGHMLVELSYVLLLYLSMTYIESALRGSVGDAIALTGTAIIMFFAWGVLRNAVRSLRYEEGMDMNSFRGFPLRHPVLVGALFTASNVWFLIWWLSIGLGLILSVVEIGLVAIFIMFASHVWIDFLWLALVAEAGKRGVHLIGRKGYGALMVFLGGLLALFGINISLKRFLSISILP